MPGTTRWQRVVGLIPGQDGPFVWSSHVLPRVCVGLGCSDSPTTKNKKVPYEAWTPLSTFL